MILLACPEYASHWRTPMIIQKIASVAILFMVMALVPPAEALNAVGVDYIFTDMPRTKESEFFAGSEPLDSDVWMHDKLKRISMLNSLCEKLSQLDRTELETLIGSGDCKSDDEVDEYYLQTNGCSAFPTSTLQLVFSGQKLNRYRVIYYPEGTGGLTREASSWHKIANGQIHHASYEKPVINHTNPRVETFEKQIPKLPANPVVPDKP
jgi:hypothetical protein